MKYLSNILVAGMLVVVDAMGDRACGGSVTLE